MTARTLALSGQAGRDGRLAVAKAGTADRGGYDMSDVTTLSAWLRYELFLANLTPAGFLASEASLSARCRKRRRAG